jgi:Ca-activated chloride channel homolog
MSFLNHKLILTIIFFHAFVASMLIISNVAFAQETAKPPVQPPAQRPASNEILINVTVTDKHRRYIQGLNRSAFTILDNKTPQEISTFRNDEAISVGIIFDTSGSMISSSASPEKIGPARKAISRFIQSGNRSNDYFLMDVSQSPQLLVDWTRDGDVILDKLTKVKGKGNTALYDACLLGVEKVKDGTHPKQVILIISDGLDNSSRYTLKDLRRLLGESNVLVYSVSIVNGPMLDTLEMTGQAMLRELSSMTGGAAFSPGNRGQAEDVFGFIAMELSNQYLIGFKPLSLSQDGKWHRLKVQVALPSGAPDELKRLAVRSREGYYAVANKR